jgi:phosphoribosylglycinamide formyltransferase-1
MLPGMNTSQPLAVAVLGSGKGSNFQALADALDSGRLPIRFACVISDVEDAFILERARRRGVPAFYLSAAPHRTRLDGEAEQRYIRCLREHGAELIVLAGFMRMLKPGLLAAFPGRILNIHPSLLPAFPGLASWKQALDYGAKVAGCTVHFVDAGMDTGPIILQRAVPVLDSDTPESLHARIQEQEHEAYPEAVRLIAAERLRLEGRRVVLRGD